MSETFTNEIIEQFEDGRTLDHRKAVAEAVTRKNTIGEEGNYDTWIMETEDPRNDDKYIFEEIKWDEDNFESHKYRVIKDNDWEYHLHEKNGSGSYSQELEIIEGSGMPTYNIEDPDEFKTLWNTFNQENNSLTGVPEIQNDYEVTSGYRED